MKKGTFNFTGLVDPSDTTVVTPQATVDYGYNWFSISDGPAIVKCPRYDKFYSVSIFDMKHNTPAVIVNPDNPVLIKRPGQKLPEGDYYVVELETDQGLFLTRMVVVDNMENVRELSKQFVMEGGKGDMTRNVQRFSPEVEKKAMAVIDAVVPNPGKCFGKRSGDVDFLDLAACVKIGQLGTPADTVRYFAHFTDDEAIAYRDLLRSAMQGDAIPFTRADGVEAQWRVVEPVLGNVTPVLEHTPGTWGPEEANRLVKDYGGWIFPKMD